jgi:hypothetical protein
MLSKMLTDHLRSLEYAPDLVDAVLSGDKVLNDAYEEAQNRKADDA